MRTCDFAIENVVNAKSLEYASCAAMRHQLPDIDIKPNVRDVRGGGRAFCASRTSGQRYLLYIGYGERQLPRADGLEGKHRCMPSELI